jgi:hypothetical protein
VFGYQAFQDGLGRIESDFPWDRLTGEPLVYASMGTLLNGLESVFSVTCDATTRNTHKGDRMLFVTSATLAVALILQPTRSDVSSTPTWETPPVEQRLPPLAKEGYVDHEGARIWYGTAGKGEPVILLHGGMESSLSWGNQVPAFGANMNTDAGAKLIILPNVSHFAPWQDPTTFNKSILQFLTIEV